MAPRSDRGSRSYATATAIRSMARSSISQPRRASTSFAASRPKTTTSTRRRSSSAECIGRCGRARHALAPARTLRLSVCGVVVAPGAGVVAGERAQRADVRELARRADEVAELAKDLERAPRQLDRLRVVRARVPDRCKVAEDLRRGVLVVECLREVERLEQEPLRAIRLAV